MGHNDPQYIFVSRMWLLQSLSALSVFDRPRRGLFNDENGCRKFWADVIYIYKNVWKELVQTYLFKTITIHSRMMFEFERYDETCLKSECMSNSYTLHIHNFGFGEKTCENM